MLCVMNLNGHTAGIRAIFVFVVLAVFHPCAAMANASVPESDTAKGRIDMVNVSLRVSIGGNIKAAQPLDLRGVCSRVSVYVKRLKDDPKLDTFWTRLGLYAAFYQNSPINGAGNDVQQRTGEFYRILDFPHRDSVSLSRRRGTETSSVDIYNIGAVLSFPIAVVIDSLRPVLSVAPLPVEFIYSRSFVSYNYSYVDRGDTSNMPNQFLDTLQSGNRHLVSGNTNGVLENSRIYTGLCALDFNAPKNEIADCFIRVIPLMWEKDIAKPGVWRPCQYVYFTVTEKTSGIRFGLDYRYSSSDRRDMACAFLTKTFNLSDLFKGE